MATMKSRFDNFTQQRAVFVFEHPETRDWIGITMCDGEILPITDPRVVDIILQYRGNLKCDIRVETRTQTGDIKKVHGFEWNQIKEWDEMIRYRFFYSARDRILSADGHLWQITSNDRGSVINSLYALAIKHYLPVKHKSVVRLFYKSLKLISRAQVELDKVTLVDCETNNKYLITTHDAMPDKFYIVCPYKTVYTCVRVIRECLTIFAIKGITGELYNIPQHLIQEFIHKCV
ncbi:hypothetical protein F-S17_0078 [Faustovirus]|nr:hypothetical protein F-S17_0078 [Faustovirus]QJX72854.1 hypothetical protein F-VV57_0092 [Faustovirus]QJX73360.1 hypothetical protein F-VV63_0094 [Faustovirus]QJX73868.1 hypothetical protein F-E9_95 [Faustovirus]SMH63357.1 Hypothetical protein FSTVLC9_322 [Faustovirus]